MSVIRTKVGEVDNDKKRENKPAKIFVFSIYEDAKNKVIRRTSTTMRK